MSGRRIRPAVAAVVAPGRGSLVQLSSRARAGGHGLARPDVLHVGQGLSPRQGLGQAGQERVDVVHDPVDPGLGERTVRVWVVVILHEDRDALGPLGQIRPPQLRIDVGAVDGELGREGSAVLEASGGTRHGDGAPILLGRIVSLPTSEVLLDVLVRVHGQGHGILLGQADRQANDQGEEREAADAWKAPPDLGASAGGGRSRGEPDVLGRGEG
mmetsp:Transcript_43429/g.80813  ORF Transcript_43429/g.80813 Transcript_43429/m.80813 type:complete len:214 (+) Transcript_43429:545-1186(+)